MAIRQGDKKRGFELWRRGLDVINIVDAPLEQRQQQELLEIQTLAVLSSANDPQDATRIPRMLYLCDQESLNKCVQCHIGGTDHAILSHGLDVCGRDPIAKLLCRTFATMMMMYTDMSTVAANVRKQFLFAYA
eukprot:COSAG01_NODE_909_length_12785_cov_4.201876_8_plen_133_part_00